MSRSIDFDPVVVLGVLAVIIAIAWPGVTVLALVIPFAVYAFTGAGLQAARAFSSGSVGPSSATCCWAWLSWPPG